jgi:tetratricopeptide (TPR) repeat protein
VHDGFSGIMEEGDLEFAGQALPANLKLLEVMLKNDPENEEILLLLSEGYSSYSLGFIEDVDLDRARAFYLRGADYGMRALKQNSALAAAIDGSTEQLGAALREAGTDAVPPVFWTAFGLGGYVNLSLSNPDALAELPRVETMMQFVASTDSAFYHAGADIFLGALTGSRPKMLGGDTEKATKHFERALRINQGTFLLTHVYYARSVALQTLNETLFDELLLTVENASADAMPAIRLPNAIAKEKARILRGKKADYF